MYTMNEQFFVVKFTTKLLYAYFTDYRLIRLSDAFKSNNALFSCKLYPIIELMKIRI